MENYKYAQLQRMCKIFGIANPNRKGEELYHDLVAGGYIVASMAKATKPTRMSAHARRATSEEQKQ